MSFATNSLFFGKINDTNPNELNKQIDYTKNSLEERKQVVDDILNTGFYEGYMDEFFKVHLTSGDSLSESDAACNSLERLANYLLNSEEVKEDKKSDEFEYKFYADEESFNKAIAKEPSIDGMAQGIGSENVIHFLKKENRNYKKEKVQRVTKTDLNRTDELGQVLRSYADYLEKVTAEIKDFENSNLSRFQLSTISGSVKDDMIRCKDILLGVFGYKTNAEESTEIDWYKIDFANPEHARAMLYFKPEFRGHEILTYYVRDFQEFVRKAKPTVLQQEIIELMRENKGVTEIGKELNIPKQNVNKNIDMLVKRICRAYDGS